MTNLLKKLRKNTTKTTLKELNGIDTTKEREEFAEIMSDVLLQMETSENISRFETERQRREQLLLSFTGKLSDNPMEQIKQLSRYITYLLKEIRNHKEKNQLYTSIAQVAYASILISDTASEYFIESDKIPTDMEMEPEIRVNGPSDIERALKEWMQYMEKNEKYLVKSLRKNDNRRIYEACMNFGWLGGNQSSGVLAYIKE